MDVNTIIDNEAQYKTGTLMGMRVSFVVLNKADIGW